MPKSLELFTATKGESFVALLYIEGEEREALNIESNSRAKPQEFVELAAVTTAIKCLTVSAGTDMSNLSGPIDRLELFLENYELYLLLTGRKQGAERLSGKALRVYDEFNQATSEMRDFLRLRLMDPCGVCDCILHRAIEDAHDRSNRRNFEEFMLNQSAPPGVLLPKYAHQSAGPVALQPLAVRNR